MSTRREHDLIINGAGVVGLSAALGAARAGLRVAVLDQHPIDGHFSATTTDPRVYALAPFSQQWLAALGAWDGVVARRANAYQRMVVWDALGNATLSFDAAELARPSLGHIVEESALRSALLDALHSTSVELISAVQIESLETAEGRVRLELSNESRLRAKLLIAADGAKSKLRSLLGVEVDAVDFGQSALVATLQPTHGHQNTAWQRFQPGGPLALLPLADGQVSMVWSMPNARADELIKLNEQALAQAITRASDAKLGELTLTSRVHRFALTRHLAQRLLGPGFVIIGDAARVVHPLAGLGLNLGLADAHALIELIATLEKADRDWSRQAALRPFERARRSESALISNALSAINALFRRADPPLALARDAGVALVQNSALLKRFFAERSLGVNFSAIA
jgi:ubiquinone biosynthesis UbiH/UbiF/VisC/COQ6 family hydroxylase